MLLFLDAVLLVRGLAVELLGAGWGFSGAALVEEGTLSSSVTSSYTISVTKYPFSSANICGGQKDIRVRLVINIDILSKQSEESSDD